jgi:SAM-dependent methyltransferase
MTVLDRVLQRWRIRKALPFIATGARVLDIGSSDGTLFHVAGSRIGSGMGIDPTLNSARQMGAVQLIGGLFPNDMPAAEPFDVITMLAVLEHFPEGQYGQLKAGCARYLKPAGHVVITVPSPVVDHILTGLQFLRLIHGMSLEEHHGYKVEQTAKIFAPPEFQLVRREKFQLGLNNLFVFQHSG